MADILPFRIEARESCGCGEFHTALATIAILGDCGSEEAIHLVALWVVRGVISEEQARMIHAFYGWDAFGSEPV